MRHRAEATWHQGMAAPERQPAGKSRAERHPLGLAILLVDAAEIAAARIKHPQNAGIQPRRVRHGEILGDNAVGIDIDEDTALVPPLAPAIDQVAARYCRDVFRPALLHGEAVQMATVLRRK